MIVPLKRLKMEGILDSGFATINMQMHYENTTLDKTFECTFEFPIESELAVTKLIAEIGDKVIEAKIKNKEEAKEQYDDAVAGGKAAVYATREPKQNEKDEAVTVLIGNLLPGKTATINIQMMRQLKITGSAYELMIPQYCFPVYK